MSSNVRSACEGEDAGEVAVVEDEMAVERTLSNSVETDIRGGDSSEVRWAEVVAEDVDELKWECMKGGHVLIIIDDGHPRSLYKQGSRVQLPMAIFAFFILSSSL
jgi:hypothetical protein